ncbi:hypothetical protein CHS0354_022322 [Potamilus streckersoni]|uniref:Anoctamin n=1 Tax=Potamilus streckersoni TaxID=2493646 RepID=A0AAE0WEC1_9BIVA|nr:hypothetical protein CHS0354_022322 [Potamilus streckersoni]
MDRNLEQSQDEKEQQDGSPTERRPRIPSRLFGRKFIKTTRLFASSKVLNSTIPTQNCDIITVFPPNTDDSVLMWLLSRLKARTPQIHVLLRHLKNTGVYVFYMTAAYEELLKGAEEIGLQKPLKSVYGGGKKEFMYDEQECFEGVEDETGFFSSQERQSIVYHMLLNLRALEGETLGKIKFLEGQSIVPLLESKGIISKVFPLHDHDCLQKLRKSWVQAFFRKQPLDDICNYFGVMIALYFAYLGNYTAWLCIPAFVGVIIWFLQQQSELIADSCFVIFALLNMLWATLYTEHWKRKSSLLMYKWGTLDKKDELLVDPRPLYTGYLIKSIVTGRQEPYYPAWKRYLFCYFISMPVIGLCLMVVFFTMLLIFEFQEWINALIKAEDIPAFSHFLPKILLAVVIGIFDEIYKKIATWLNYMENYRLEETYNNHLIIKLVMFQFVNSFLSLFYIAFYLQDMDRLRDQLAALLITRQVIGNIREAVVPYFLGKAKLMKVGYEITGHMTPRTLEKEIQDMVETRRRRRNAAEKSETCLENRAKAEFKKTDSSLILSQAEVEITMSRYEDTFDDYLEMFIQYGYVILFSSSFPLAGLCALLNNIIEIRSDAFKLCMNHQRPFGRRVQDIGTWKDALEVMGAIAVFVNCALIGMAGQVQRLKPGMDTTSTVLFLVVLEHIVLALKFCIAYAIPDIPKSVATEMARLEFCRREALKKLESQHTMQKDSADRHPAVSPSSNVFSFKSDSSPYAVAASLPRSSVPSSSSSSSINRDGNAQTGSTSSHSIPVGRSSTSGTTSQQSESDRRGGSMTDTRSSFFHTQFVQKNSNVREYTTAQSFTSSDISSHLFNSSMKCYAQPQSSVPDMQTKSSSSTSTFTSCSEGSLSSSKIVTQPSVSYAKSVIGFANPNAKCPSKKEPDS